MGRQTVSADCAAESYPDHPAMALIRRMNEGEIAALKSDVSERGLIEPLKVLNGELIDGRHRLLVCRELGIEVEVEDIETDDPEGYVRSLNVARRHLSTYERAQLANAEATQTAGGDRKSNHSCICKNGVTPTQTDIAEQYQVAPATMSQVKAIDAEPSVAAKVSNSEMSIRQGYDRVKRVERERKADVKRTAMREAAGSDCLNRAILRPFPALFGVIALAGV